MSHHGRIKDYLPEIVLCCIAAVSMVFTAKCKTDAWGLLIVSGVLVHLFWRGVRIIREGWRNKRLMAAAIKAFVLLPVIDFAVLLTSIAVVQHLAIR
jgi:hypothetical protein